ncbi:unnamed protein product [Coregonus sp. 'balchen']|nr:unnamed protein product [Coregonus sp. 'balchen']
MQRKRPIPVNPPEDKKTELTDDSDRIELGDNIEGETGERAELPHMVQSQPQGPVQAVVAHQSGHAPGHGRFSGGVPPSPTQGAPSPPPAVLRAWSTTDPDPKQPYWSSTKDGWAITHTLTLQDDNTHSTHTLQHSLLSVHLESTRTGASGLQSSPTPIPSGWAPWPLPPPLNHGAPASSVWMRRRKKVEASSPLALPAQVVLHHNFASSSSSSNSSSSSVTNRLTSRKSAPVLNQIQEEEEEEEEEEEKKKKEGKMEGKRRSVGSSQNNV